MSSAVEDRSNNKNIPSMPKFKRAGGKKFRKRVREPLNDDETEQKHSDEPTSATVDLNVLSSKKQANKRSAVNTFGAIRKTKTSINTDEDTGLSTSTIGAVDSTGDEVKPSINDNATATLDDGGIDARDEYMKNIKTQEENQSASADGKKLYRGQAAYSDYREKNADTMRAAKLRGTLGPMRAPSHIRTNNRFDYQPDICKDYYETGFCGYGDTCIFLHMREEYKPGWKVEQEWQEEQRKKQEAMLKGIDEITNETEEDTKTSKQIGDLPFACFICRKEWHDEKLKLKPVKTLCGHYMCEACAMARYKVDSSCPVCHKETYGIFNFANEISDAYQEWRSDNKNTTTGIAKANGFGSFSIKKKSTGGWGQVQTIQTNSDVPDTENVTAASTSNSTLNTGE